MFSTFGEESLSINGKAINNLRTYRSLHDFGDFRQPCQLMVLVPRIISIFLDLDLLQLRHKLLHLYLLKIATRDTIGVFISTGAKFGVFKMSS